MCHPCMAPAAITTNAQGTKQKVIFFEFWLLQKKIHSADGVKFQKKMLSKKIKKYEIPN